MKSLKTMHSSVLLNQLNFCSFILILVNICENASGEIIHFPLFKKSISFPFENPRLKRSDTSHGTISLLRQKDNLHGKPGQGYYVQVAIGTPPQLLDILIDTGSSNFAVAAHSDPMIEKYFNRQLSSSYVPGSKKVYVPYTQGNWKGILGTDMVHLASIPNIAVRSNIAFITESSEFFINGSNWEGILGLGYATIAQPDKSVEPFFDTMVRTAGIGNIFSMQLCGQIYKAVNNTDVEMGGSLILGGVLPDLHSGRMFYTPIHKEWFYEVVIVDIAVDGKSLQMDCKEYNFGKTIVDSGTTNLRLPRKVFDLTINRMKSFLKIGHVNNMSISVPGEGFWQGNDHLCWPEDQVPYSEFPVITITFPEGKNSSFDLLVSPKQYLRPVGEKNDEDVGLDCFKFGLSSSDSGSVIGAVILEGYYVVFDRANKQIGFSLSTCPERVAAGVNSTIAGPHKFTGNALDCAYFKAKPESKTLVIVGYVMAGIVCLCLLPLTVMMVHWQCRKWKCYKRQRHNSDSNDLIDDVLDK